MDDTLRVGFVGVSSHRSFVLLDTLAFLLHEWPFSLPADFFSTALHPASNLPRIAPSSLKSTKSTSMPMPGFTIRRKYRCVPPYTSSTHSILSPGRIRCTTALVAALPLEKATAYSAPSAAATDLSNSPRVGLPVREYSYPEPNEFGSARADGAPGLDCAKVVERDMGGTTAPVGLLPELLPSEAEEEEVFGAGVCRYVVPRPRYGSAAAMADWTAASSSSSASFGMVQ
mmetsp:Transcript_11367/g.33474  ORF Transcript_11367/g.33474 Transcript_11367/m.33474 type:complete len:229 (-) Transcript_11367:368-1054(-)